jgi:hypothetical protein
MGIAYDDGKSDNLRTGYVVRIVPHERRFLKRNIFLFQHLLEGATFIVATLDTRQLELAATCADHWVHFLGDDKQIDAKTGEIGETNTSLLQQRTASRPSSNV